MEHSEYEAITSVAKAASHLLRHLLTVHESAILKRTQVISGIIKLLDQSLVLAKHWSATSDLVLNTSVGTEMNVAACKEIFQAALQCLNNSLENWRHEEFQVIYTASCLHACLTNCLTDC